MHLFISHTNTTTSDAFKIEIFLCCLINLELGSELIIHFRLWYIGRETNATRRLEECMHILTREARKSEDKQRAKNVLNCFYVPSFLVNA